VALALDKSLADFNQSQAKTKPAYRQNTKHGPAEPFHLLHMAPMSAVEMLRGLCVDDFGHATPLWVLDKSLADFNQSQAKSMLVFTDRTPSMALLNHFISFIWVQ
jgi:hypothetical protein